jgi:hypothetical protein
MRRILASLIALSGILAIQGAAFAADDKNFRARLRGGDEVPSVTTDTRGKVKLRFNNAETKIKFRIKLRKGVRITQAHLHCAPEGANGPVVAFLAGFHDLGWDVNGNWIRKTTLTNANIIPTDPGTDARCPDTIDTIADLLDSMLDGNIYVNVHSMANPDGEVRGQVEDN